MPTFGPVLTTGNIVQAITYCTAGDQTSLNVFHYRVETPPTSGGQLSGLMANFNAGTVQSSLIAALSSGAAYWGYTMQLIFPTVSIAFADNTQAAMGGAGATVAPRQVAALISKRSAVPGRRKGGRFYVPFPDTGQITAGGGMNAAYLTLLQNLALALTSGYVLPTGGTVVPIILDRTLPGNSRLIAQWVANGKWATQRRRGSYGRPNPPPS